MKVKKNIGLSVLILMLSVLPIPLFGVALTIESGLSTTNKIAIISFLFVVYLFSILIGSVFIFTGKLSEGERNDIDE